MRNRAALPRPVAPGWRPGPDEQPKDPMAIDWKNEAAAAQCLRFWAGRRDHYQQEGAAAPAGAACPYPPTSFAALHWRRGHSQRSE